MLQNDTIAAIATGNGGAMGVVRLSGECAVTIAEAVFAGHKRPSEMAGYTATLGRVQDDDGELDECVLTVFRAPYSYTGEDVCEFSCHGSRFILERLLAALIQAGARPAGAGEFTRRALLNGKLSLTEAEAVAMLVAGESRSALRAALEVKDGRLWQSIGAITDKLTDCAAHIAAWIDYPEEDVEQVLMDDLHRTVDEACKQLDGLVSGYGTGRMLREGIATAIVGSPNVGKSTLMNLLAGCERSIVTNIAGTTRDVIEETVRLGDILLRLCDTAGLRSTLDPVEKIGVERSERALEQCELVLAIFDGSRALDEGDLALLNRLAGRLAIGVLNKSDLPRQVDLEAIGEHTCRVVELSALEGDGIAQLEAAVAEVVGLNNISNDSVQLMNDRQLAAAVAAVQSLGEACEGLQFGQTLDAVSVNIEEAINDLLELTGERAGVAVIDKVFEQFCVGK